MLEGLWGYLSNRTGLELLRDGLDIFLVYYVVYRALLVLKGTRAMQVSVGLGMVFILWAVAKALQLVTLLSIVGTLISSMLLIIVVVFAPDIRRGLQRVGSSAWFGGLARAQESEVIDEVVEAATELARHRTGAIITFEQDANLDEFVGAHTGHVLDAKVTSELLVSLFIPESMNKLHDGAVIVRDYRVAKAGVFFPMPEGRVVDPSFGSRHRAALGITEETDAVVVVVSEERGTISFCFNGNIASNLDGPKLRTMLEAIFSPKVRKKSRKAQKRPSLASAEPKRATPAPSEPERSAMNRPSSASAPERMQEGDGRPRDTDGAGTTGSLKARPSSTDGPRPQDTDAAGTTGNLRARPSSADGPRRRDTDATGTTGSLKTRPSAAEGRPSTEGVGTTASLKKRPSSAEGSELRRGGSEAPGADQPPVSSTPLPVGETRPMPRAEIEPGSEPEPDSERAHAKGTNS